MHTDSKAEVRKHLVEYIETQTTDYAESTMRIDADMYFDPNVLEREYEHVIKKHPVVAAHATEVPDPGSFVTVSIAGTPLLIVRQDDGSVKAFSNICRHRGALVETKPAGHRKMFACPYHAWCYNRDGSIRTVPFEDGFQDIDDQAKSLVEYPADEYAGLVWVIPSPGTTLDMNAYIGSELGRDMEASRVADAKLYRTQTWELDMNWKLVMDGFTDAYHLQFVHPDTVGPFFHTNIYKCDVYGKNWRMVVARRGIEDLKDDVEIDSLLERYAIASFDIYPGTVITCEPEHYEVWSILPHPQDLHKSTITLRFLVPELPTTEKAKRLRAKSFEFVLKAVRDQDWPVAKTIADGLRTAHRPELFYGRNEKAAQHFHKQLMADMAD